MRPKKGRTPTKRHEAWRAWRRCGVTEAAVEVSIPGTKRRPEMAAEM